ncbi:putative nucleotidyltransferase substrate binding domain-containing protein [Paracoccus cavernae]|uniref:Nucleotidyltransferase substrate binding domain-containing protein n=1 Tax=Paracoccus cavernae TaxID=1571207 RepID=A0ABT8D3E6_9RHOB|nr:putative nucleotidyltransferase substrate binding domain-containing protein [Paracoccus cavernae]
MRQRIFAAKPADSPWEVKVGPGRLQDIELLAQSFALRAAAPARGTIAQLRAGQRAGLIGRDEVAALGSAYRFFWTVRCTGKLLSEGRFDPATIGYGGRDFCCARRARTIWRRLAQGSRIARAVRHRSSTACCRLRRLRRRALLGVRPRPSDISRFFPAG